MSYIKQFFVRNWIWLAVVWGGTIAFKVFNPETDMTFWLLWLIVPHGVAAWQEYLDYKAMQKGEKR